MSARLPGAALPARVRGRAAAAKAVPHLGRASRERRAAVAVVIELDERVADIERRLAALEAGAEAKGGPK